jgi:hypothetical protein
MTIEDVFLISTGDDMIEGSFVFYAGFSSHERKMAGSAKIVNMSIPKSDPRLRPDFAQTSPGLMREGWSKGSALYSTQTSSCKNAYCSRSYDPSGTPPNTSSGALRPFCPARTSRRSSHNASFPPSSFVLPDFVMALLY